MDYDIAVVGAGYVGLPLSTTFAEAGCHVLVVDVVEDVVEALNRGETHIEDVGSARWAPLVEQGLVRATTDYAELKQAEAILIALPTPLSRQREPDLSIVEAATRDIASVLQKGQVVVLESTTWPGTTREILQPLLEQGSGLKVGEGFYLAMSPERVDAEGARRHHTGVHAPRCRRLPSRDRLDCRGLDTGSRRAHEAAREHLPLGEHRARERARATLRPHVDRRVGGRRRCRHEAVRLHAVQPGPRSRRPLHPDRSLLPDVESARVRLLHGVHRARREGERGDALLLPVARLASVEPFERD